MIVILMYVVGTLGLIFPPTQPYFKLASAFNLWVSLILLLFFHQQYNKSFIATAIGIFLAGFFIEVIGVHTGMIFGIYWYGQTLGAKILGVPLVIGANWLLLIYCSNQVTHVLFEFLKQRILKNALLDSAIIRAFFASFLMVCLDFLIEPVAIHLDFWHWQFEKIPSQNFQAWFLVAFILSYLFLKGKFIQSNALAVLLLVSQFLFFISINIFNAIFI
jgi:putative membrane protein